MNALCRCGCGRAADPVRSGLSKACSEWWRRHGRPDEIPVRGYRVSTARAGRIEDYLDLRSWGLSADAAADRLGLSRRTITRYEASVRNPPQHQSQVAA